MPAPQRSPGYKRILLKLSGESLMGDRDSGINPLTLKNIASRLYGDAGYCY
jgi:uridylate kinase